MALPTTVKAKQVTLHFFFPYEWDRTWAVNKDISAAPSVKPGIYVYNKTTESKYTNGWPGDTDASHKGTWSFRTNRYGVAILDWTGDIDDTEINDARVMFNDNGSNQAPAPKMEGYKVIDGAYYDINGLTDIGFELVATASDGTEKVFPMSSSRVRDEFSTRLGKGKYSTSVYSVGLKDELLPGAMGENVKVYVRGINYTTSHVFFRPTVDGASFGTNQVIDGTTNTSLTYYGSATCASYEDAINSTNTFVIQKGSGVSYTIGLYNEESAWNKNINSGNVSYTCSPRSLSLHINQSIISTYDKRYNNNYSSVKEKSGLEDYYIIGSWDGTDYKWDITDEKKQKMVKQIFLNPINKNIVDSVVYSKVVAKPENGFGNLYLSFVPSSVRNDRTCSYGTEDVYTENERYNFVTRAEVQDQFDVTAQEGCVFISGVNKTAKMCNGQQALNPLVTDEQGNGHNYYIIRLNVTTSTYRIEFVNNMKTTITKSGIRTFCSRMNLLIPDGYKAYVAHSFDKKDAQDVNGLHGDVNLRRLKYIPANEGVVLVADHVNNLNDNPNLNEIMFEVLTDATEDDIVLTENEKEWWYYSSKYNDEYNNYLVPSLYGTTINNGTYYIDEDKKYNYTNRHFALNYYHNTKYFKSLSKEEQDKEENKDYIGFFRSSGKVGEGYAYLRLPSDVLDYNGQILGDFDSNNDEGQANPISQAKVKMTFSFDDIEDNTTSIVSVKGSSLADDAYYTLQGMKVVKPGKGIYIHQGKKIIIK